MQKLPFVTQISYNKDRGEEMNNLEKAVLGALIQDKYALGLHWIYDTEKVKAYYRDDVNVFDVQKDSFHKTKSKGDFTHYGDILVHFMEYMNSTEQLDVASYYEDFVAWMSEYQGYKDHATKMVVENFNDGNYKGSDSSELGGLVKISPILMKYAKQPDLAKLYAIAFTKATHDHPIPVTLATFFTDLVYNLQKDMIITQAIDEAMKSMPMMIVDLFKKAKNVMELEPVEAIKELGQACPSEMAFPSVIYLLLKYQSDAESVFKANVLAGGDSAARGIMLGMVLGAAGYINEESLETMNQKEHVFELIKSLKGK